MKDNSKEYFFSCAHKEIASLIKKERRPRCVGMMFDGTRRLLKLSPKHHKDTWLYEEKHIRNMMHQAMEVAGMLCEMGISTIIGPLASKGNLMRRGFMPKGLELLLKPLLDKHSRAIIKKYQIAISFYGRLKYIQSLPQSRHIQEYLKAIIRQNPKKPQHRIALGLGFCTREDTQEIARLAIEFYKKSGKEPTLSELSKKYFGIDLPPIDIFIRTNEIRTSGGLPPLLTGQDTQFYFPISPGILSMTEETIKAILYDYLFERVISGGKYLHQPVTSEEAGKIRRFYEQHKKDIIGVGRRVGDIWMPDPHF